MNEIKNDKSSVIPSPIAGPQQFQPQAPTPNPQAPGTTETVKQYSIWNEKNEPIDLPVVYWKLYKVLYTKELMSLVASLGNPLTVNFGTANYYIEQRGATRNYSQGTKLPLNAKMRKESLSVDWSKEIKYTFESLDFVQFGVQFVESGVMMDSAFLASINDRMAKAEMMYNQIKLLDGITSFAKDHIRIKLTKPGKWVEQTPGKKDYVWVDDSSIDAYRKLWLQFTTFIEQAKSTVTSEYVGLDIEDFTFVVGPNLKVMINMFPVNYGDRSSNIITNMNVDAVSGVPIKTIPFLGITNFAKNDVDEDENFDLTGIDGILIHKEAWAFPILYGETNVGREVQSGNLIMLRKFRVNQHGGKAIRPDLIWGIQIVKPEPPKDAITVNGILVRR